MTHRPIFPIFVDDPARLAVPPGLGRGFTPLQPGHATLAQAALRSSPADHSRGRVRPCLALAIGALLSSGCGTFVRSTYVNEPPRPLRPVPPESVEVFAAGPPERAYVDVALFEVEQTQSANRTGMDYMLQKLRKAAGSMGCDGVVLAGATEHSANQDKLFDNDSRTLIASCIVYADPERASNEDPPLANAPPPHRYPPPASDRAEPTAPASADDPCARCVCPGGDAS